MAHMYTITGIYSSRAEDIKIHYYLCTPHWQVSELNTNTQYTKCDIPTHVQANNSLHSCYYTNISSSPFKSCKTSYWPSQVYCSWHLKGPLNNWSQTSWLVRRPTWYICPATFNTRERTSRPTGFETSCDLDKSQTGWVTVSSLKES